MKQWNSGELLLYTHCLLTCLLSIVCPCLPAPFLRRPSKVSGVKGAEDGLLRRFRCFQYLPVPLPLTESKHCTCDKYQVSAVQKCLSCRHTQLWRNSPLSWNLEVHCHILRNTPLPLVLSSNQSTHHTLFRLLSLIRSSPLFQLRINSETTVGQFHRPASARQRNNKSDTHLCLDRMSNQRSSEGDVRYLNTSYSMTHNSISHLPTSLLSSYVCSAFPSNTILHEDVNTFHFQ